MDGASLSSGISVGGRAPPGRGKSGGGGTKSGAGTAAPAAAADALLALRDECQQAKLRERAAEDRARQLAAQLMRTEEAAKRVLTRTDPSARGGCAQRLLDAEREVYRLKAAVAEAESALAIAKTQGGAVQRQAAGLKKRLDTALADQRRLALQLGRSQAGGRSGLPARPATCAPRECPGANPDAACGEAEPSASAAEAEAAASARRFAEQQEQLAAARERNAWLELLLRQRDAAVAEQAREVRSLQAQLAGGSSGACGSPQHQRDEALAAGNARLQRELEEAPSQVRRLQLEAAAEDTAAASPGAATLRLRKQLASANHRAARLQIELEAAAEKLSIYEEAGDERGGGGGGVARQQQAGHHQQAWQAAAQQGPRVARVEQWLHAVHG